IDRDMVLARRRFMDGEYYAPLAECIADIICDKQKTTPLTLIDAGVGTGFYLNKIVDAREKYFITLGADPFLPSTPTGKALYEFSRACARAYGRPYNKNIASPISLYDTYLGVDISKTAVRYAAKLNPAADCCVASVYDLPFDSHIADVVTCIFSPYALEEYKRVLKPDGLLVIASPCENHLIELRRALYEDVREVEAPIKTDAFETVSTRELTYEFNLSSSEDIAALLMMTPYAYRAPLARKNSLLEAQSLSLTADFKISMLKPSSTNVDKG
ncbi:MAG: methyltransferase domain-containing protein, partial [Clostridia bacterium]|nr:methyltransferase domain-containing protein [Clostridia bacterium]